jgi:PAS domain S-box-containing protein
MNQSNTSSLPLAAAIQLPIEDACDHLDDAPLRVMLLADAAHDLNDYAEVLRSAGIQVFATADPLQVMAALESYPLDLLLLASEMPGWHGAELIARLRQYPDYVHLPVLFLTTLDVLQDTAGAEAVVAEHYLLKPVVPALLLTAVKVHASRFRTFQHSVAMNRKQERQARHRLEQFRMAIDEHAIVSIADVAGKIIYVNKRFCDISGYSQDALLGQSHRVVRSEFHPPAFFETLWQTISSGHVWQGEICNRSKFGHIYWVEATIIPFFDTRGLPSEYISIRTDITALKATEEAVRVSEERLRCAQDYANMGTWEWNIKSGELFTSARIAALFGLPARTVFERSLSERSLFERPEAGGPLASYENLLALIHAEDRELVNQSINRSIHSAIDVHQPCETKYRITWPDGSVHWLLQRGSVQRDAQGEALKMLCVVQDITAWVEAEASLHETEARFAFAVEGSGDGVWDWNMQTNAVLYSGHYETMLGYAVGELEKNFDSWRNSVHPDDLAYVLASLADYLAGTTGVLAVELRLRTKQGDYKWVLCRGTLVARDAAGLPQRMIGIHSDISEHKAIEAKLLASMQMAERANRAKSDFLSSMSHELRTPMNAIIGFAQMLEYDSELTLDQLDNVNEILKAGRHLLELINEVLDLAKIESGRIELSLEAVDVVDLAEECRLLIQPLAAERDIELVLTLPARMVVRADRMRFKQALLNLLSNAVKYNQVRGRIHLSATALEGRWQIVVADTGIGIAPEYLDEVFQPFNRLDAELGEEEGTGIGLTITRRIIEMMQGRVGVESEVGVGSRFWIELPAEISDAADTPSRMRIKKEALDMAAVFPPHDGTTVQRCVLYIEDNPANLKLVAQILSHCSHIRLLTAQLPELGIELALAQRPDLILLDINMPGMNGYQVLDIFKADARLKATPVIAITANAMPCDIERGMAAGFVDYLIKPLDVVNFLDKIDHVLHSCGDVISTL